MPSLDARVASKKTLIGPRVDEYLERFLLNPPQQDGMEMDASKGRGKVLHKAHQSTLPFLMSLGFNGQVATKCSIALGVGSAEALSRSQSSPAQVSGL